MVILLSITESETQVISGIPEYVEFSTNMPATVFYTLDGTTPDDDSEMTVGRIYLPTDGLTVTLKAIAISGSLESDVLEEVYFTNNTTINKSRHVNKEGIRVLPPGSTSVDSLSFDADGEPAQKTAIPFVDLEIKASTSNLRGEPIPDDSSVEFIRFPIELVESLPSQISSPNNNNLDFDPQAKLILIDGSTESLLENQSVRIINRPHGTMDLVSDFYNEHLIQQPIVSSNFVRSMLDPKTGKIVFYYRDSRENRWIKSVQRTEPLSLNLTPKVSGGHKGFVFRWIEDRNVTKIF